MTSFGVAKALHAARHGVGGADYVAPAVPTTVWTSGALVAGVNTVDATAGAKTPALPTPTLVGQLLSVEKIDSTTNTVTVSGTIRGVSTSVTLRLANESVVFEAESLTSWRPLADHKTLSSLDGRYLASPAQTGTPTINGVPAAVSRWLDLKKDFGAVGDGTTDDSAAINAWATAGGNLYAPAGTYLHNGATRPRITTDNTHLRGDGTGLTIFKSTILYEGTPANDIDLFIIGQGPAGPGLSGAETTNVQVEGITFAFSAANPSRGTGSPLRCSRVNNLTISHCQFLYGSYALQINRANGFWIHDNEMAYSKADGINANNGSDTASMGLQYGDIHDNWVHDTNDDAIAIGGAQDGGVHRIQPKDIHVHHNRIDNVHTNGAGIGVYGVDGAKIDNNRIFNPVSSFINVVLDNNNNQFPSKNIDVSDNWCYSNQTASGTGGVGGPVSMYLGGRNAAFSGSELSIPFAQNIRIEGNTFIAPDRSGLWCQPNAAITSAQWLQTVIIKNNTFLFTGSGTSGMNFRGMHLQFINDLVIQGNRIEGFPSIGVNINQFTKLRWTHNDVVECLTDSTYAANYMCFIGNAGTGTDTLLDASSNTYRKTSGSAAGLLSLRAAGTVGAYLYSGNRFYSTGTTISTAVETLTNTPTVPAAIGRSGWNQGYPTLGAYSMWVDATGALRLKSGAPTGDTDGTAVGGGVPPDANGHISPTVLPVGAQQFYLARRTGALAETFSRIGAAASNQAALTAGQQYLVAIPLLKGTVVTNISFMSATTAGATMTNQWFGLWSSALAQLGLTTDDTSTAWAANAIKTLALSSPYTVTADGLFYLSIMVAGTTPPSLFGVGSAAALTGVGPALTGRDSTHTGLTNPASAPATAVLSTASPYPWAYVS